MERSYLNKKVRLFLKLIFILSLILLFDRGIGIVLKHAYLSQKHGQRSRTTYAIDSTLAEILILGSSRASHSYIPEIFENKLHYSCYNAGMEGISILYSYAIFKAITKRFNPKLIIFDIGPYELNYSTSEYERLSVLLPYFQKHPEIKKIINLRGPFENVKHFSTLYLYNSLIFEIVAGNLESKHRVLDMNGYVPLNGTINKEKIDTLRISNCITDENKIKALKDIIATCKQRNINLIFVYSPIRHIYYDNNCNTILSELFSGNGISYLDMSNHPIFMNNSTYFNDFDHLNDKGARIFSNMIVDKILQTN